MSAKHSIRTFLAVLSAISIWLAALLQTLQSFGVTHDENAEQPSFNETVVANFRRLDPPTLRQYFNFRKSQGNVDVAIDLLFALGLLTLAYCVLCLKRVFKRWTKESDLPNFMTGCFFIGSLLPSLSLLQTVGNTTTCNWIAGWPNLPDDGIQILYVANVLNQGTNIYLLSMMFLFISIGLALTSYLSWKTADLPRKHAILGGVTAGCGFVAFILEVTTFQSTGTGLAFGVFLLLWGIILLPAWTVWLGVELRRLKIEERQDRDMGSNSQFVADTTSNIQ